MALPFPQASRSLFARFSAHLYPTSKLLEQANIAKESFSGHSIVDTDCWKIIVKTAQFGHLSIKLRPALRVSNLPPSDELARRSTRHVSGAHYLGSCKCGMSATDHDIS